MRERLKDVLSAIEDEFDEEVFMDKVRKLLKEEKKKFSWDDV